MPSLAVRFTMGPYCVSIRLDAHGFAQIDVYINVYAGKAGDMKPIRVLPPAVVIALTASLAASPAWAADAAAPAAATPTAVTATAAGPVDKATIPAFDTRFVVSAAEAARVA
jgi:hypothetical protein